MAKYYHGNERDEILSEEQIRAQYEEWKADGTITPDESGYEDFDHYLELCMWYNNGDLTPLRKYISDLRLYRLPCLADDPEEKEALESYIKELEAYESEV